MNPIEKAGWWFSGEVAEAIVEADSPWENMALGAFATTLAATFVYVYVTLSGTSLLHQALRGVIVFVSSMMLLLGVIQAVAAYRHATKETELPANYTT